jgi:group I intron endonuclease
LLIYKATNIINHKVYIGQTIKTLDYRKRKHINNAFRNPKTRFHQAIIKYGEENFIWTIVENNIESKDILNEKEIYWILFFNSFNNGYNDTKGGKSFLGYKFTEESKKKMSLSHLGQSRPCSKEHREKISKSVSGKNNGFYGKKGKDSPFLKYIYYLESPDGEKFETYIINDFCKQFNLKRTGVYKSIINNRDYKGWKVSRGELNVIGN